MSTISNGTTTVTPILIEGYESVRASRNITHSILSTNVPAFSLRPAALRTGKLKALVATRANAVTLETVLSGADLLTFADSDIAVSMSFVVTGNITVSLDDNTRREWWVEFDYSEVTL